MRRAFFVVGGLLLGALACGQTNIYADAFGGSSSGVGSSGARPPDDDRAPVLLPRNCTSELTTCGVGCCTPGSLCLLDACATPGLACESDLDCTADRYCESSYAKCLPRPAVCDTNAADAGADTTCLDAHCAAEKSSISIVSTSHEPCDCGADGVSSLGTLRVRVQNRGRTTVPAGVVVRVWRSSPSSDAGSSDAGQDGGGHGSTREALIPGQSTDVVLAWPLCTWFVTIDDTPLEDFPDDCNARRAPLSGTTQCSSGYAGGAGGE